MDSFLNAVPDWLGLVVFMGVSAAAAIGGQAVVRRYVAADHLLPHHDVAGFLVSLVGLMYAVVLGFLIVNVWATLDSAQRTSDLEADDVGDLYSTAQTMPGNDGAKLRDLVSRYAVDVRDREFSALNKGQAFDPATRLDAHRIRLFVARLAAPVDSSLGVAIQNAQQQSTVRATTQDLIRERRQRLLDAKSHLPDAMYFALVVGALAVVAFVYLFAVSNAPLQFMMTGIVAGTIGLLFGLIVELDGPYSGAIKVKSDAWQNVIAAYHMQSPPAR